MKTKKGSEEGRVEKDNKKGEGRGFKTEIEIVNIKKVLLNITENREKVMKYTTKHKNKQYQPSNTNRNTLKKTTSKYKHTTNNKNSRAD